MGLSDISLGTSTQSCWKASLGSRCTGGCGQHNSPCSPPCEEKVLSGASIPIGRLGRGDSISQEAWAQQNNPTMRKAAGPRASSSKAHTLLKSSPSSANLWILNAQKSPCAAIPADMNTTTCNSKCCTSYWVLQGQGATQQLQASSPWQSALLAWCWASAWPCDQQGFASPTQLMGVPLPLLPPCTQRNVNFELIKPPPYILWIVP